MNRFEYVIHVALRIHTPRNREPYEIRTGRVFLAAVRVHTEHHRADLAAADACLDVEFDGKGLARVLQRLDVRQETSCIEIHRVTARRCHDRDA